MRKAQNLTIMRASRKLLTDLRELCERSSLFHSQHVSGYHNFR